MNSIEQDVAISELAIEIMDLTAKNENLERQAGNLLQVVKVLSSVGPSDQMTAIIDELIEQGPDFPDDLALTIP